ncbi:MAG: NUDIX domain-containing protein, partial [Chitinophagaceae bacterium]
DHQGVFPREYDHIRQLKGVGPYTAAAIASFAYDLPYAVVDGNVQRVLARYFGLNIPIDSTKGKKTFADLAQSLLPREAPALFNQAIMDFGATICKPRQPLCANCIYQKTCRAFAKSWVDRLPVKEKKIIIRDRWLTYLIIRCGRQYWVRQRTEKDIWNQLYEFVLLENKSGFQSVVAVRRSTKQLLKLKQLPELSGTLQLQQQLSHQTVHARFYQLEVPATVPVPKGYKKVSARQLNQLAFPLVINSYLQQAEIKK